ncbi:glycosyltransferase family 4 protein [Acinetobacter soli]|uniref:glycosyltransferase family 4 protein n=1 Tax=Acinetobacter soli TaxID=487316 RepID=UPI00125CA4EB|nr:glycosyltransferase family 1 protein [Acinetobacter soli]
MYGIPATTLLKQQQIPESFKFYFKRRFNPFSRDLDCLNELVRPRLKIAIVTETWPPEINGVAMSLLQLCKGLQAQGHKILLIRPQQKRACAEFTPHRECLVHAQKIPKYPELQFGWPQYLKVSKALESFAPDVVHIVTEGPLGLCALYAAQARKIPLSSGFHSPFQDFSRFFDLAFLLKPIQSYLRWFHNHTQMTCVPSKDTEKALRAFGVTCPLAIVGRGVDPDFFSPSHRNESLRQSWQAAPDTCVMLYVGRLSPEKEIDLLIENYLAMQRTERVRQKLVIVGDGPDRARLQALDQNRDVIFTGSLSGRNLAEAYASADVFVFASQVETFGNVVLEAMASGLPVVAYDYACAHQYVQHGVTGWLSPVGQPATFIHNMRQLPAAMMLRQMGRLARQRVEQDGWQFPVQQMEQALYRVVKEPYMTSF